MTVDRDDRTDQIRSDQLLLREQDELQLRLGWHTVPICQVDPGDKPLWWGTGVLVKLGRRHFVFTAGHCVRDSRTHPGLPLTIGIQRQHHRFDTIVADWDFVHVPGTCEDYGYWELPGADAITMETNGCVFISEQRLEVDVRSEHVRLDDQMIVAGYPLSLANSSAIAHGVRLFNYSTFVCGSPETPEPSILLRTPDTQAMFLWLLKRGNRTLDDAPDEIDLPTTSGMSGGGIWRAGMRRAQSLWSARDIRLTATHAGVWEPDPPDGNIYSIGVLIGNHLRLISDKYSDLRPTILSWWPRLEGWRN